MQATGNDFRRSESIENKRSLNDSRSTYAKRTDGDEAILYEYVRNRIDNFHCGGFRRYVYVFVYLGGNTYECLYRAIQIIKCDFYR